MSDNKIEGYVSSIGKDSFVAVFPDINEMWTISFDKVLEGEKELLGEGAILYLEGDGSLRFSRECWDKEELREASEKAKKFKELF